MNILFQIGKIVLSKDKYKLVLLKEIQNKLNSELLEGYSSSNLKLKEDRREKVTKICENKTLIVFKYQRAHFYPC
jgi:hypothetical protein